MAETHKKFYKIFTLGHSTRSLKAFLALLKEQDITCLVDVRTIPRSRHNPQFNQPLLSRKLPKAGIRYQPMPGLGGLRHAKPDSINTAWRNASFRGFADYMQTREFVKNLQPLIRLSKRERVALMCAEAVPWRCHRSLIADALLVRRFEIFHMMGPKNLKSHAITPWAKVQGVKVWYPG
jgi:uncharacterized protein (DUF488 family)